MEDSRLEFRADVYNNDVASYLQGGYVSDRIHELALMCELMMVDNELAHPNIRSNNNHAA